VPTTNQKNDRWALELPWGMPKDTHLLPLHSQELLRAARSGRLYKRKAPADEEDASDPIESVAPGPTAGAGPSATPGLLPAAIVTSGADAEKAEERKASSKAKDGVWVKVWKRVPRDAEVPSNSHLAKRHKNTIILPSKASTASFAGPTVTRVTVRRVDAAGNAYEQTVTVNDDTKLSQIGGEIVSTTTIAAPAAVETAAQLQPTPTKRRPPPPPHKKKHKGPGRGRKKKLGVLPIPLPANPNPAIPAAGGVPGTTDANVETPVGVEVKPEDSSATNHDTEMGDNSQVASDDEEDEEDEGDDGEEEEGEAKEEGMADDDEGDDAMGDSTEQDVQEEQDRDQEMEDANDDIRDAIQPSSIEEPTEEKPADVETEVITKPHIYPPANPMNPGPAHPGIAHLIPPRQQEGSPLKNVVLQSPIEPKNMNFPNIEEVGSSEAPITAPDSSTQPTTTEPVSTGNAPPPEAPKANPTPPSFNQHHRPGASHNFLPSLREPPKVPTPQAPPANLRNREMSDDDGGLDLLGGLERELDRQSRTSSAVPDLLTPAGQGSSSYGNTPADNPVLTPGTGEQPSSEEQDRQP
jgi:hypothetical protein